MPGLLLGEKYFADGSLLRVANKHYFLVVNGTKGGSFRLYSRGKVYYDSGLEIASHKRLSTGILDKTNTLSFEKGSLRVSGAAKVIVEPLFTAGRAILFKLWQVLAGHVPFLQGLIKKFLRSRMISYAGSSSLLFERTIEYASDAVTITDSIRNKAAKDIVVYGVKAAYSAVPSSKYAAIPELALHCLQPSLEEKEGEPYIIKRAFSFHTYV